MAPAKKKRALHKVWVVNPCSALPRWDPDGEEHQQGTVAYHHHCNGSCFPVLFMGCYLYLSVLNFRNTNVVVYLRGSRLQHSSQVPRLTIETFLTSLALCKCIYFCLTLVGAEELTNKLPKNVSVKGQWACTQQLPAEFSESSMLKYSRTTGWT